MLWLITRLPRDHHTDGRAQPGTRKRRGLHGAWFKALASGADVVALGRPVLYGLALGGWQGVRSVLDVINRELSMTMQLAGVQTVAEIRANRLMPAACSIDQLINLCDNKREGGNCPPAHAL